MQTNPCHSQRIDSSGIVGKIRYDGFRFKSIIISGCKMDQGESGRNTNKGAQNAPETKEQKLARQLRENLAKRKAQSRVRNTKPRKFKKNPI